MNGTITQSVKIYYTNGKQAWGALTGDTVIGNGGSTINKLYRKGVKKLDGVFRIGTIDAVKWDTTTPPPVEPPTENPLYTIEFYKDGRLFINGTLHT